MIDMKTILPILFAIVLSSQTVYAQGQQAPGAAKKTTTTQTSTTKPAANPAQTQPPGAKPEPGVAELIAQGKTHYRAARFKQAMVQFEAALKQEPQNDEALGLAAITAFRLDNQVQSRGYFLRRAELPNQKDSVKAFCYYRMALTYWRDAHDIVAKYGDIEDGKLVYNLPDREYSNAKYNITNGLQYVDHAIAITNNYAEAYNIKNLLHAEAALAEKDDRLAKEYRNQSKEALVRAIELSKTSKNNARNEAVDFSRPTVRIAQYAATDEEEEMLDDPMMKMIVGGKPVKRVKAAFPTVRLSKPPSDPNDSSPGSAQTTASKPVGVTVEVLVSTTGEVVFAHVIDGRSELNSAAILAARSWKFEPARFEGNPVQVSGVISFDLKP